MSGEKRKLRLGGRRRNERINDDKKQKELKK
jgi:hypothetical protein